MSPLIAVPIAPAAPSNTEVLQVTDTKIKIAWTDNSGNEDGFHLYRFYKGLFGNPDTYDFIATAAANVEAVIFPGLSPVSGYVFAVSAFNSDGESDKILVPLATTTHTWSGIMLTCAIASGAVIDQELGAITKGALESIDYFECSYNDNLTTMDPALQDLKNVTTLHLYENNISGSIPTWIGSFSALRILNLEYNNLSGSIPVQIGNLSSLEGLDLDKNQLTGGIPSEIGNLTALNKLSLQDNYNLGGTIPSEIGNLTALESLYLNDTNLSGIIPSEIGNLEFLITLSLSNNELNGTIPSEIGNLTALKNLYLNSNHLNGNIPLEIGNLTSLEVLYLDSNHLNGNIPLEIGNLELLRSLRLSYNELDGTIPSEIGMLLNIESLGLSHNNLSGIIPSDITDLSLINDGDGLALRYNCNLSSNDLTVKNFIDLKSSSYGGYQDILDTNHGDCQKNNMAPIIMYLLN